MSLIRNLTEDEVRDGYTDKDGFHNGAKQILEFDKAEINVQQGTGQLTTFKNWASLEKVLTISLMVGISQMIAQKWQLS